VRVVNGVVTLSGAVDNLKALREAEREARDIVGVRRVHNLLKVRPDPAPDNETLARNVQEALARDVRGDRNELSVEAMNGVVWLNGVVDTPLEKSRAEDVASRVHGVAVIRNNLEVNYKTITSRNLFWAPYFHYVPIYRPVLGRAPNSDLEIREDIEGELYWSPFVDSDRISVKVEGGVATLTGQVDSWADYHAVAANAYEGGAREVQNRLEVLD
jgi:osmotically-inducible protein OsmY